MEPVIFLKALAIGFVMAVPIGPAGVMSIRMTLAEGHWRALTIGFGAATADSLFSSIAAFSLTFISNIIASQQSWLSVIGGGLLLFLGIRTLRDKRKEAILPFRSRGLLTSYISGLLLALSNPVTFFAFVAVFAAFGLGYKLTFLSASVLVFGVAVGSSLWFLTLGYVATLFRKQLDAKGLRWVNLVCGSLILLGGITALVRLV